jgi:sigma-54 specific flagellar transcriptional regulator A
LLERLAILYPEQTISAKDLPERYRSTGSAGWIGSGVRLQSSWDSNSSQTTEPRDIAAPDIADSEISGAEISGPEVSEILEFASAELPSGGIDLKDHLCAIEIGLIRRALVEADGTVAEAARLLRIRRTTLVEKLRKYRLSA